MTGAQIHGFQRFNDLLPFVAKINEEEPAIRQTLQKILRITWKMFLSIDSVASMQFEMSDLTICN